MARANTLHCVSFSLKEGKEIKLGPEKTSAMHPLMVGAWLRVHQIFVPAETCAALTNGSGVRSVQLTPFGVFWSLNYHSARGAGPTLQYDTKWKGEENDKR